MPGIADLRADGPDREALHAAAAAAARSRFGRSVFVRGVVEVSNFCRENCDYCGMRRDNRGLGRFRSDPDRLADMILGRRPASMTDLNIQTGEDPVAVRGVVLPLLDRLRRESPLGLSVCLGTLDTRLAAELMDAGASIYIVKFEVADPAAYARLHAPGTQPERLAFIRSLSDAGWKVSSGFIAGLPGQTATDLLDGLRLAASLPLVGCSVSPFVPGEETPLRSADAPPVDLTLNAMAALRLMRPDWVIPAVSALNLAEPGSGYRRGLRTGANLCTINLTPEGERGDYLLYRRDRFIMSEERILDAIAAEGLAPSTRSLADFYGADRAVVAA
jgi:biotin synthase